MDIEKEVDIIVQDCFFAIGQTIGRNRQLDYDAVVWWRNRYREKFTQAILVNGASWATDRPRVTAVARFLGLRASEYAEPNIIINRSSVEQASLEVEQGCRMQAQRN
jgi:hypothetical protein